MKKCYLSQDANPWLIDYVREKGYELELIKPHAHLDEAVSCHPDMYMCQLKDHVYHGTAHMLKPTYPGDVLYNAAVVGKYILCSKHTSLALIQESGLTPVLVPQGYVKCNVVVVDDSHIITEDAGIAKALKETDMDCLLVQGKQVLLPGYAHGFLGGASGKLGEEVVFHGDLSRHPDFEAITAYIRSCGLKVTYFEQFMLTDIGSILIEE